MLQKILSYSSNWFTRFTQLFW